MLQQACDITGGVHTKMELTSDLLSDLVYMFMPSLSCSQYMNLNKKPDTVSIFIIYSICHILTDLFSLIRFSTELYVSVIRSLLKSATFVQCVYRSTAPSTWSAVHAGPSSK